MIAALSPCGISMLFGIKTSMFEYCFLFLEVWSVILLASLFSPTLGVAYDKEKSFLSLRSTCLSQVNLLLWTSILL